MASSETDTKKPGLSAGLLSHAITRDRARSRRDRASRGQSASGTFGSA
jgi:hypothetical protein